ncbi:MAG: class I SAM-dependent methyltransferase [Rickettsiales bacterium]|nr:class I SAM-dependent methyltransferase [Rickettsiales bacterium]
MIRPDVVQLRQFYTSALGRLVRAQLGYAMRKHWPELHGDVMLGIGYANPLLRQYLRDEKDTPQVLPIMPSEQGAICWPSHRENRASMMMEDRLPIADNHVNRIVLLHQLEHVDAEQPFLHECWRVLSPGGRMMVMVPNRRTAWAGSPRTPFSYGRPYSISQLREALCDNLFTHVDTSTALFFWPTTMRSMLQLAGPFQTIGRLFFPKMGGVIVMEVEKQIYASVRNKQTQSANVYVPVGRPAMTRDGQPS